MSLKNKPYKHGIEKSGKSPVVLVNISAKIPYNLDSLLRRMVFILEHSLWILIGIWIFLFPEIPSHFEKFIHRFAHILDIRRAERFKDPVAPYRNRIEYCS